MHLERKASRAAAWLRGQGFPEARRALLAGTGRGGFSNELARVRVVPLRRVPGCREPILPGWNGVLIAGELDGGPAFVQEGRLHLFEGFLPGEVAFTVRVLAALGVRRMLFVGEGRTLAEGETAEATLAVDRLDLAGVPLLRGALAGPQGPVFDPAPTPEEMRAFVRAAAAETGVRLSVGVAAMVHGPAWPTPAERRMLHGLGADVATLALAPELATAARLGVECAALLFERGVAWERRHVDLCRTVLERL